ncbi:protein kinase domain-containing protein [Massilia timonae]|uniref:Kinase domain protein n=1 Tax=Massilia timonae TaxID=47229 RepID=A0A1S2N6E0_9BURK|nr:protein kinase [Massilia timonae]OIJ40647.1 kinase domain protein [Massilia timonae]
MYEAGTVISLAGGQYRLREALAGSAYGVVWRADSLHANGSVALKLVNLEQMARAPSSLRARWLASASTEIAFLRGLAPWDGRHIVRLLDSGEHAGMPAMALELLDGDLAGHLTREMALGRTIAPARALAWIGQVNQALAKVHASGWRYLDLKPGNLLLDAASDSVKLADFGTNRRLDDLRAHTYAGTANWQAPEQFFPDADGYATEARTDYFALGALLYYLVGGRLLRYSSACGQAWQAHGRDAAASLLAERQRRPAVLQPDEAALFASRLGPAAAPGLALLRALVAERPADRPRHALDISRALADAVSALHAESLRSAA